MSRRQLFARTPRGEQSRTAATKRSATIINGSYLKKFQEASADQSLKTLMLKSNTELNLTVSGTGGASIALIKPDGSVGADQSDINKIFSINTFINSERKTIQKETTSKQLEATLATIVTMSREPSMGPEIVKLPDNFIDVYRAIASQVSILTVNVGSIENLQVEGNFNSSVKNYLLASALRIKSAAGKFIRYRAASDENTDKLNSFLKAERVLNWVFTRLTGQRIQVNTSGFQMKALLFPKDPSKGLSLTFAESIDEEITGNQGGILDGMKIAFSCIRNEQFLYHFLNLSNNVDVGDHEDPVTRTLSNVPIMVVPPIAEVQDVVDVLAKQGSRGFSWSVGQALTPADNLRFIGTIFKRSYYLALNRSQFKSALFSTAVSGFVYQPEAEHRDIYTQLKSYADRHEDHVKSWLRLASTEGSSSSLNRYKLYQVMADILQIPEGDPNSRNALASGLQLDMTGGVPGDVVDIPAIPVGIIGEVEDVWNKIILRRASHSNHEANRALLQTVMSRLPGQKKKKKEAQSSAFQVRSGLAPASMSLITVLQTRNMNALARTLDAWLRSFLDMSVQGAVAEMLAAKLDWHLSQPIVYGREEQSVFIDPHEFEAARADQAETSHGGGDEDSDIEEDAEGDQEGT